jgi:excisionase family DNA binding protein
MASLGDQTFTPEETAQILKKHLSTIRRWLRDGTLKAAKVQRSWIVPKAEIERLLGHPLESAQVAQKAAEPEPGGIVKNFLQTCTEQGEDPEEVMHNLMAGYVQAIKQQLKEKEASGNEDERPGPRKQ